MRHLSVAIWCVFSLLLCSCFHRAPIDLGGSKQSIWQEVHTLQEFRDRLYNTPKFTVIMFGAIWCGPCHAAKDQWGKGHPSVAKFVSWEALDEREFNGDLSKTADKAYIAGQAATRPFHAQSPSSYSIGTPICIVISGAAPGKNFSEVVHASFYGYDGCTQKLTQWLSTHAPSLFYTDDTHCASVLFF